MSLPLQSSCDPNNPEEHALWALLKLPGSGAPLIVPEHLTRQWSKHLYECGFRHQPEYQKIKYIPPTTNANWVTASSGKWVDINESLTPYDSAPDISHLSQDEKHVLFQRLAGEFLTGAPQATNRAGVENG